MGRQILISVMMFCTCAGISAVSKPPSIYKQPDFEIFFNAGERVTMPCKADATPNATYTWTKNNRNFNPSGFDDRMLQLQNEGTFLINRTEDKDEGIYQCLATNDYGVSASINIKLRKAKLGDFQMTDPITHQAQLGSSLTLQCVPPESIPKPRVIWNVREKNGTLGRLVLDARVTKDHEYRLRITNVKSVDHQDGKAYICKVWTPYARRTVTGPENFIQTHGANEEQRPVTYMWASPSDQPGLRGETFRIKCIFAGNPTPDVNWSRSDGKPLPEHSRLESFGQELVFYRLQFSDAGEYECLATNNISLEGFRRKVFVRVESRPYWTEKPRHVSLGVGETAHFRCYAHGVPEPGVMWYINNVPLRDVSDTRIDNRFQLVNQTEIWFMNVTRNDAMVIQCNVTNKHGYIWGDVYLDVVDRPDPVYYASIERCENGNATISWTPVISNIARVQYYVIQYNTSFTPTQWVDAATVDPHMTSVNINLSPFANFTFRVVAHFEFGGNKSSHPTLRMCRTPPARPFNHPVNIRTIGDKKLKLHIKWTPMPQIQHNGPGFQCILSVKRRGDDERTTVMIPIDDWRLDAIVLHTNDVYRAYEISLKARNSVGEARVDLQMIIGFSGEDFPDIRPRDLHVAQIEATRVTLSWNFDMNEVGREGTLIRGEFRGFMVRVWRRNLLQSTMRKWNITQDVVEKNRVGNKIYATITNLQPNTELKAQVSVMNNFYVGPPTDIVKFQTKQSVPDIVPRDLHVAQIEATRVTLSWNFDMNEVGREDTLIRGEFRGFMVRVWRRNLLQSTMRKWNITQDVVEKNRVGNKIYATITNLQPNTELKAQVSVMNNFYVGPPTDIVKFKTKQSDFQFTSVAASPSPSMKHITNILVCLTLTSGLFLNI